MTDTPTDKQTESNAVLKDFLKVFLFPMLVNKTILLYFGVQYANYPGEGYGYGLIASIVFLIFNCARFVWKYRHIEDP